MTNETAKPKPKNSEATKERKDLDLLFLYYSQYQTPPHGPSGVVDAAPPVTPSRVPSLGPHGQAVPGPRDCHFFFFLETLQPCWTRKD